MLASIYKNYVYGMFGILDFTSWPSIMLNNALIFKIMVRYFYVKNCDFFLPTIQISNSIISLMGIKTIKYKFLR